MEGFHYLMQRLASPVWRGASPLLLLFGALTLVGLVLQLYQGWVSPIGDAVWVLAFLTVALIGLTARAPSGAKPGLLSRISTTLLGIYSAGLMAYWIVFDNGYLATLGWQSLLPILVLAALVAVGSIQDRRRGKH